MICIFTSSLTVEKSTLFCTSYTILNTPFRHVETRDRRAVAMRGPRSG